ncbi:MAG TPA: hypothetical protein VFI49_02070 [Rudaea sp.]|nr:hypothetical protein [Rudaea sp.]
MMQTNPPIGGFVLYEGANFVQKYFFLTLSLILSSQSGQAAQEVTSQDAPDLGEIYQFSGTDTEVGVINNSDHAITVKGIVDPSNRVKLKHAVVIEPRHVGQVPIEVNAINRLGLFHADGKLITTPPVTDPVIVGVNAFVNSILEDVRPVVDFGMVESGAAKTVIFRPVSEQPEQLRLVKVESVDKGFNATIVEDGKALSVTVEPNARWGTHFEFAKVKTDSTLQKELWVRLKANIQGAVVASADPVDFSVVRQGSGTEQTVLLEGKSPAGFEVESVQMEGAKFSYVIEACPQRVACASLKLKLDDAQPTGEIFGKAWVKFRREKNLLPINIRGLVLAKDQKIIEIPPMQTSGADGDGSRIAKGNLTDEIKAATSEAASPQPIAPVGTGPLLKWSVAYEAGVYGYIVYRSTEENGRFVRVNKSIVKATGSGSSASVDYQWRDNSAETGKTYWYRVGLIYNDGHKSEFTGPQKVVAK